MQISPDIAGLKLKEFRTEITWRPTTNYASAVGDMNPCYFDDSRPEGLIAPPVFVAALTWPIQQRLHEYVDIPGIEEAMRTVVHYTEHIEYYRPLKPGDRVSVGGEVLAVTPHKAGTLLVLKFSIRDWDGNLIATEHVGGLLRGVRCEGGGRGGENLPQIPRYEPDSPPVWEVSLPIGREAPYIYDGCTDIVFAIHTSPRFARAVGLPDIIYQGTATLALAVRELVNREAGGNPSRLHLLSARFGGMVFPGTGIRVQMLKRLDGPNSADLFFQVINSEGQKAVTDGYTRISYQ